MKKGHPRLAVFLLVVSIAALYFGHGKKFFGFAWNSQDQACIPNLHLAFFLYSQPSTVRHGDYVFWRPYGALANVRQAYVVKEVAGIPGDKIKIADGAVFINGKLAVKGFENAPLYSKHERDFEIDEVIPKDRYFVVGTAQYSNDSRYWGYLPRERIAGTAYRVF